AENGLKPYFFVYSSFSQRCYDQINHDISRMDLPVHLMLDRASLVGADGETHHGVFDISIFSSLPNIIIAQAAGYRQACDLVETLKDCPHPTILRFPRAETEYDSQYKPVRLKIGKWESVRTADEIDEVVITYGDDYHKIIEKAQLQNKRLMIVNALFIKPLDKELLDEIAELRKPIHVFTSDVLTGGLPSLISEYYMEKQFEVEIHPYGIGDHFVSQGSVEELRQREHITVDDLFSHLI
ncbi:MAG: 1-deoxy-D-xylulose-5-phosphate synthase, partial [Erysipelotrichaceae bacterium]|nr:1-deoxy-D-xylulose-5-phosphate synthase [Erysipelotrichaceae bacterium]